MVSLRHVLQTALDAIVSTEERHTEQLFDLHSEVQQLRRELKEELLQILAASVLKLRRDLATGLADVRGELSTNVSSLREEAADTWGQLRSEMSEGLHMAETRTAEVHEAVTREFKDAHAELAGETAVACNALDAKWSQALSEILLELQNQKLQFAGLTTQCAQDIDQMRIDERTIHDEMRFALEQTKGSLSAHGGHEVVVELKVTNMLHDSTEPFDFEFPLLNSKCLLRLQPFRKVSGKYLPGQEFLGVFFGFRDTRIQVGGAANRLESYSCAVRVEVFDPRSSSWLRILEQAAQEHKVGGTLFGVHEALPMKRFWELMGSELRSEKKLTIRVLVSDVGAARLVQCDVVSPNSYGNYY